MKWQHVLMAMGVVVGIWLAFFTDKTPDPEVAEAIVRPASSKNSVSGTAAAGAKNSKSDIQPGAVAAVKKNAGRNERVIPILALASRQTLISVGHVGLDGKKLTSTAPLFNTQSWAPPPPSPPDPRTLPPPPPPMAPPLRFTFLGKKFEDGLWEVFLAQGDSAYVVRNQSVIDNTYRVDAITPVAVIFTYLPLNQVQRLNIKGAQ